jgi:hypothetical protein
MTSLRLYVEGVGYIEGDPESLACFAKVFKTNKIEEPSIADSVGDVEEGNKIIPDAIAHTPAIVDTPNTIKHSELNVPSVTTRDIEKYIMTKDHFAHDTVELQYKFLGRRVKANEEPTVFNTFDSKIRRARTNISKKLKVKWDLSEKKRYEPGLVPTVYQVKRMNKATLVSNNPENKMVNTITSVDGKDEEIELNEEKI